MVKLMLNTFTLRLKRLDKYDDKNIKQILTKINAQIKEKGENESFIFFGRTYNWDGFVKAISIFGAYLSDEFEDEYINSVYKAAFDINEFAALGDFRDAIEEYVEHFPIGKRLKLTTLIKRGQKLVKAVQRDFGVEVLEY